MGYILVVDDEPMHRDILSQYLEDLGHRVETASDGFEAKEKLDKENFDVILLDYEMPRMNGGEVISYLEHLPLHDRPVPFLISGQIPEEILDKLKRGFGSIGRGFHYLKKPINKDPFILAIRSAFIGKRYYHAMSE